MERQAKLKIISIMTGFLLGTCFSMMGIAIFYLRQEKQASLITPSIVVASTPTLNGIAVFIVPSITKTITSIPAVNEILSTAENYASEGRIEEAKDLILPVIETWESNHDKSRGYQLLGDSEIYIGHYQLAAPYYEKMYFYEPTPENLFILAFNYDAAGDLCKAYTHYQELLSTNQTTEDIDVEFVKARVEDIKCSIKIGTP